MIVKTLASVTTKREKKLLKNVRWGRLSPTKPAFSDAAISGSAQQEGTITGVWQQGCALVTRHSVLVGENIWIKAKDEFGQPILSMIGTVIWNENCFRLDGFRCEVRFRQLPDAS